jgi:hypothetical protein
MKINDLLATFLNQVKPEAKPAPGGADFAATLKEVLGGGQKTPAAIQGLPGLAELTGVNALGDASKPAAVLDTVLSRLDTFRAALAQTDVPLKKLSGLVQQLEQDSQKLHSLAQSLPANSPLRKVMDEAAALAYTESFKFNRGDYV